MKYQDRIVCGKHLYSVPEDHGIGKLHGRALPDDVMKKLRYKNALRIFSGQLAGAFPS